MVCLVQCCDFQQTCELVVFVCSFVNQTVTAILNTAGVTSITGDQLNTKMTNAADASQWSWVTYPWSTSSSISVFTKRAVVGPAGTRGLAKQYYLGAGYNIKLQGTVPFPCCCNRCGNRC